MVVTLLMLSGLAGLMLYAGAYCAPKLGLVDIARGHKTHQGAVPYTGGLSVLLAAVVSYFLSPLAQPAPFVLLLFALAAVLAAVAFYDDIHHNSPRWRLLVQIGCASVLVALAGDAVVLPGEWFSIFRADGQLAWLAVPLSITIIVAITNAINMMDGMDGLAASLLLLPFSVLAVVGMYAGHPEALLPLCLAVPLLVFLAFNLSDGSRLPKLFLGDAGSMTLGFMLAACLLRFSSPTDGLLPPLVLLWLVALPLWDGFATFAVRLHLGQSLMQSDQRHIHHVLRRHFGLSRKEALFVLQLAALSGGVLGLLLIPAGRATNIGVFLVGLVAFTAMRLAWSASEGALLSTAKGRVAPVSGVSASPDRDPVSPLSPVLQSDT